MGIRGRAGPCGRWAVEVQVGVEAEAGGGDGRVAGAERGGGAVDASFEEVRRGGVAQGVDGDVLACEVRVGCRGAGHVRAEALLDGGIDIAEIGGAQHDGRAVRHGASLYRQSARDIGNAELCERHRPAAVHGHDEIDARSRAGLVVHRDRHIVTVEKKEAKLLSDKNVTITDLPGIYSLSPYSPEEQ